ncbi:MAG: DUF1365 domain-containing protein [Porticoccaceae bacterium]|nr:MAG: DUF1365 domain-containing protein [Porticoccaceae bacterium]
MLIDPEARLEAPALFSRNRWNLAAVCDRDYGSAPLQGPAWARDAARRMGFPEAQTAPLRLLTAPRLLGGGFNPVSFWFFLGPSARPRAVIAEVNNTYGDRHAYFCHLPGYPELGPADEVKARKIFHVSPFQEVAGEYAFRFALGTSRLAIRIIHRSPAGGLAASLAGRLAPMTNRHILRALARQPLAPIRTLALIHWQALRLWLKGAPFRPRPLPPTTEISR